VSYSEIGHPSS